MVFKQGLRSDRPRYARPTPTRAGLHRYGATARSATPCRTPRRASAQLMSYYYGRQLTGAHLLSIPHELESRARIHIKKLVLSFKGQSVQTIDPRVEANQRTDWRIRYQLLYLSGELGG